MNCCSDPRDGHFGEMHAKRDLKRYLDKGPDRTTRLLLQSIRDQSLSNVRLLDIGAGIGVIYHELLEDVCAEATHVDLSSAYNETAKKESMRRHHDGRVRFVQADFATDDSDITESDVVTLDRVVCCYPDYRALLTRSAQKAGNVLALSYPRDRWYIRLGFALDNFKRVLKRDPFRAFVHATADIENLIEDAGFQQLTQCETFLWRVSVYQRTNRI